MDLNGHETGNGGYGQRTPKARRDFPTRKGKATFVEESNLNQNIFMLRKALGDTPEDRRYIVTLPGKGYRFAAEVRTVTQDGDDVVIGSHSRSDMVVNHTGSSTVLTVSTPAPPPEKRRKLNWKHGLAIAACVAIAGVGGILYLRGHQPAILGERDSLVRRETPRLCRGGSRSLTNPGVHRGDSQA